MTPTNTCPIDAVADDVIDYAILLDRFEGDTELIREVAALFLEDCPRRMDAVRDAVATGDCSALQSAAHSLRGSVSNFAASAAAQAALHLEVIGRDGAMADARAAWAVLERELARLTPVLLRLAAVDDFAGGHAHTEH